MIKWIFPIKAFWNIENVNVILLCRLFTVNPDEGIALESFAFKISYVLRDIIIYHLTFLKMLSNVVFLTTIVLSQLDFAIVQVFLLSYFTPPSILVDTISRDVTRVKCTLNNLRSVSYFARSVIIIIYFTRNLISKKYFSWTVMKPLSLTHICVSVNVCKQTTTEIKVVTCTTRTIMDILQETPLIMGYQHGGEIMTSLFTVVAHMQKLSY
jgi:hypothetical protein